MRFSAAVALLLAAAPVASAQPKAKGPADRPKPNVVLIVADEKAYFVNPLTRDTSNNLRNWGQI
jgi:hypothetical protein